MPTPTTVAGIDQAITAGIAAVESAAAAATAPDRAVACDDIGKVFDTAIEHGAPVWNKGSQIGCARIYLHTARALLTGLRAPKRSPTAPISPGVEAVVAALGRVADKFPEATPENASKLGWALRGVFDQFHAYRGRSRSA